MSEPAPPLHSWGVLPERAFYWRFRNRDGSASWYSVSIDELTKYRVLYGVPTTGVWAYELPAGDVPADRLEPAPPTK